MNKTELRDSYIAKGWEVQPVAEWRKVSEIEGKVKYDVNVVTPDNSFSTASVVVTDEGGGSETAIGVRTMKETGETFVDRVNAYVATVEGSAQVFAVHIKDWFQEDSIAVATVWKTDGTVSDYVLKERDDTITHQELV